MLQNEAYGPLPCVIFGLREKLDEPVVGGEYGNPAEIIMKWESLRENEPIQPKLINWGESFISLPACQQVFEKISALDFPYKMTIEEFTKILDDCGFIKVD